jgi:hypothetical protein
VGVGAEVQAPGESAVFPQGEFVKRFGSGGHEDGGIVTEYTSEDHDEGDGEEDPVAVVLVLEWRLKQGSFLGT